MTVWISSEQERKARWVVAATLQFPNPTPSLPSPPAHCRAVSPSCSLSPLPSLPVLLPRSPPERFVKKLQAQSHQLKGDLISKISLGKRNYP